MPRSSLIDRRSRARLLGRRSTRTGDLVLAACALALFGWMLAWQYSLFAAGTFAYQDLTLICDWFSNAIVHGRPFWWTDEGRNFLSSHFMPTLLLLTPIFAPFSSQFALIAVSTAATCAAIYLATRDQQRSLAGAGLPTWQTWTLTATFLAVFALNRYTARIVSSAHFEPLFLLTAFWLVHALRRGWSYAALFVILFLSLGIKEDAGFNLFFLLFGCLIAPRGWRMPRRKLALLAATCVVYVVVASMIVLPWFGTNEGTWAWRSWGKTWPEVFEAFVTSPLRVWHSLETSEFDAFNRTFSFVPMLSPFSWLSNQLGATLLYTADSPAKKNLEFYNASFLLPGMMLGFAFAQLYAVGFVLKRTRAGSRWRSASLSLVCALFVLVALHSADPAERTEVEYAHVGELTRHDPFVDPAVRDIVGCANVHSIASDFRTIVFAPFRLDKYLLTHATNADVVLVPMRTDRHAPHAVPPRTLIKILTNAGNYARVVATPKYQLFERAAAICRVPAKG